MTQDDAKLITVQGRQLSSGDIDGVRKLIRDHRGWSRRRLSIELSERWDWRNEAGRLKDMSCRNLLLKLHRRGLIELPASTRCAPHLNARIEVLCR